MEFIMLWVIFGGIAALIASNKGHGGCAWFTLGVLFGPFAILAACIISKKD